MFFCIFGLLSDLNVISDVPIDCSIINLQLDSTQTIEKFEKVMHKRKMSIEGKGVLLIRLGQVKLGKIPQTLISVDQGSTRCYYSFQLLANIV